MPEVRSREQVLTEWKPKGYYPTDDEGVLLIGPYWKKALILAEQKRNKKFYWADVYIVCFLIFWVCFFWSKQ